MIKSIKAKPKPEESPLLEVKPDRLIAIDPGDSTAYAVIEKVGNTIKGFGIKGTTDFWGCYELIKEFPVESTLLIIENGGLVKHSFHRADLKAREQMIKTQGYSDENRERLAQDRMSRNVGKANAEADLLIKGFERLGFHLLQVKPAKQKWSAEDLAAHTGYDERTNQHVRDAMRMVWENKRLLHAPSVIYRKGMVL